MPMVHCDGREISYEAGGPVGAPLLAFLPPGASGASIWRRIASPFQDRYRTVAVNPSGYGATAPFDGPAPLSVKDEAAAVEAVIRAEWAGDGPAHIVGHSYGGTITLVLAGMLPDLVSRLTLLEPAPYPLFRAAGETELSDQISGENQRFIALVREGGREPEAMEQYLDFFNNQPGFWNSLAPEAKTKMIALSERLAISLDAVERLSVSPADLATLRMPVTVAYGSATDRLHSQLAALVAQSIPDARLRSIPDAGHMMTLTHGEAVVDLIRDDLEAPGA